MDQRALSRKSSSGMRLDLSRAHFSAASTENAAGRTVTGGRNLVLSNACTSFAAAARRRLERRRLYPGGARSAAHAWVLSRARDDLRVLAQRARAILVDPESPSPEPLSSGTVETTEVRGARRRLIARGRKAQAAGSNYPAR